MPPFTVVEKVNSTTEQGLSIYHEAIFFSESKNFLSRGNRHINQSITSIIDHPKMPRFSKRAKLLKELEAVAKSHVIKAYLHFYLDVEDSFEDDLDHYVAVKLFALKSSCYAFREPYRTWVGDWEWMLYDGTYMTDDEFLSNFRMDR